MHGMGLIAQTSCVKLLQLVKLVGVVKQVNPHSETGKTSDNGEHYENLVKTVNLNLKTDEKGTNLVHLIFANHNSWNLIFDFLPIIMRIFKEAAGRIWE